MSNRGRKHERRVRAGILSTRLLCTSSLSALALLALPSVAHAQDADRHWDANGQTLGTGGTGTWDTTNPNWSETTDGISGPYHRWDNTRLDNAIFGSTAGTVTLGTPITVHNITFNVNGYTLTGNTLTLSGTTPTIRVDNNHSSAITATINSNIIAAAGLTKAGADALTLGGSNSFTGNIDVTGGTLTLNGANTLAGNVNVTGSTLTLNHASALGAASNQVNLSSGAVLNSTVAFGNRTVNLVTGESRLQGQAGSAHLTGAGSLLIDGGVTLSDDTNDFAGNVRVFVNDATAYFTSIADAGLASAVGAGDTIHIQGQNRASGPGEGADNDDFRYIGAGPASTNRKWIIEPNAPSGGPSGAGVYIANFSSDGAKLTLTGDIEGIGTRTVEAMGLSAGTGDIDAFGVISSNNTRPVSFTGSNINRTITLGTQNTFTGEAMIGTATVKVASIQNSGVTSSLGAGSSISITAGALSYTGAAMSTDRTWALNGSLLNDGTGAMTLSGAVTVSGTGARLGGSYTGSVNRITGAISGIGALTMNGAGTWELDADNTFTGLVTVQNGTLRAARTTAFGGTTSVRTDGGTLDLNGASLVLTSIAGNGGTISLGSGIGPTPSGAITVNNATAQTYGGAFAGSGALTKQGLGVLTLTGASSFTGPTSVQAGTLKADFSLSGAIDNDILSASSAVSLSGGGMLHIKGAAGETNSQTIGGLNIISGANTVRTEVLTGGTLNVNLGTISRTAGTVNFDLMPDGSGNVFLMTANADGALGGWAMIDNANFAKVVGGRIVAFDDTDYTNKDDAATWSANEFINDDQNAPNTPFHGVVGSSVQIAGLRYNANSDSTVIVADGQTLGIDGAILVTPSVGGRFLTITGGRVTGSAGGGAVNVQQNSTSVLTINSAIVDNGGATGFTKGGTGRAQLGAANTYTGVTTLSQGTLLINALANGGSASSIGASSADSANLVLQGGTLQYVGATDATTDRGFTLVNAGLGVPSIEVGSGRTVEFQGQVTSTDDQGLTKTGAGRLTLSNGGNNYVGATTIGGTLSVDNLANGGLASGIGASSAASANLVLQNGGELEYTGGTVTTNRGFTLSGGSGAIDVTELGTTLTIGSSGVVGTGGLTKNGAGTLILCGTNSYSGGTTVTAGTLRACSTSAFGTWTMTVNAGATLDLANFSNTVRGLNGGGSVALGSGTLTTNGNGSFSGTINGTGGLTVSAGTQTMSGCTNAYTGATRIDGVLSVGCLRNGSVASDIGASPSGPSNLLINGTLQYTGGNVVTNRGFQTTNGTIDVSTTGTLLEFTGQVTGTSLTKSGTGTLLLSGTNTYGGVTIINGGTLRAGSNSAFGTSGIRLDGADTTLDLNGLNITAAYIHQIAAPANRTVDLTSATLTLNGSGGTYSGTIIGTGNLVRAAGGTQTLSGCASSYSGTTTISGASVLQVHCLADGGSNSSIGSSGAGAGNLVISGSTLRYLGAGSSTDRLFTLSGVSAIESSGTGALSFTNTGAVVFGTSNVAQTVTLGGTNAANNIFALQLTDNGTGKTSLTKDGAGTWILTNSGSTYTGITRIIGGVLGVDKLANGGDASSIGASGTAASNLVIGDSGTLRYTGAGDSTDRLFTLAAGIAIIESAGTGAVKFTNTNAVTLQTPNQAHILGLYGSNTGDNTIGGSIGNGTTALALTSVVKNGSGKWILAGTNTYTGTTNVNQGTLVIGDGLTSGSIASAISNVAAGAVLGFNRSDTVNFGGTIQGDGAVHQLGTGTTIITGANTYTGGTTIAQGTLQLGSGAGGGATGSIVGNVANSGTLAFNRSNAYTFNGAITGTGTIAQIGTGTTTLTAANTAGATTISAGMLQINGSLETGTVSMADASILAVNGTMGGAAGGTAAFTGDAGASTVNVASGGTLRAAGDLGGGSDVVNVTGALNTGAGTLSLGDGNDTLVFNDPGTFNGSVAGGAGTDALHVNNAAFRLLNGAGVTGFETLTKTLTGTLVLTGDHSFTNGVTLVAGTLQIGDGTATGTLFGNVANAGTVTFNRAGTSTYAGVISGTGVVNHNGSGTTIFTGNSSYTGATNVNAGTLLVNGNQSSATGLITVFNGAALGGSGTIGGSVLVENGGTLSPGNSPGVLTINGDLLLNSGSVLDFEFGQANVPGGPLNDLIDVGGNLTLDGTINVTQTAGGSFGPGVYRIINYGGALTDSGLVVGTMPGGSQAFVQTAIANQVNLVNTAGLTLNFWDGAAGPKNDGTIQGGDGTWRIGGGENNWTDVDGAVNADYAQDSFAIFQGTGGTVTVDNSGGNVLAAGLQFTADGYEITGAALTLTGAQALVRVGDGSPTDIGITATISAELTGSAQLVKDLGGTLVLTGTNTYTGGTAINGGTLRISGDANLGDAAGALSLDGGTLNTTASLSSARTVGLAGAGTFLTDTGTTLTLSGVVSGAGALIKDGAGTLVLTNANTHAGGTTIGTGTLQLGDGGTTGSIAGNVTNNGVLTFNRSDSLTFAGTVSGTGAVNQIGSGTTILTADNSYTGGTTISAGVLELGVGGTTGGITGDVVNNAALVFNRSNQATFAGLISGTGRIVQAGSGTTILTGANSYAGTTEVIAGTLLVNGDQSAASGPTFVAPGATLGGIGTIGGDVLLAGGATLAPGDATGPGTLTINGNMALFGTSRLAYDFGQSNVVGGPLNDLTQVGGDLGLDGTIDVTVAPGGSFDVGVYRVISYGGVLTDNGLSVGAMPAGSTVVVQTSVLGQVNLVNSSGLTLNFWDGAVGPKVNGVVNGGDGIWQNSSGNDNWADVTGGFNGPFNDGAFAIFSATPSTVTIDNGLGAVSASGLQFASDGYIITGQDLTLVGPQSVIRVGDGTTVGLRMTATIGAALVGNTQLVKTDLGTLVLTGTNSYDGGTLIDAGTLRISSDANLGAAAGALILNGGTLNTTADITSARNVALTGTGTFITDAGTSLVFTGALTGAGDLVKDGAGVLALNDTSNHSGTTTVRAGSLFINGDLSLATGLTSVASGSTLGGSGIIGGDVTIADGGTLAPGNSPGTLTINGGLSLSSGSVLNYEFGEANVAGGSLNDLVNVGGGLVLDGTINVTVPAGGSFGPGIYRVFNYGGALTDNGLALGTMPGGSMVSVQTAIAGQVNLVNTAGLTLSFWDGDAGPKNNGTINGGNGTWRVAGGTNNWTDTTGSLNADYAQDSFAIFSGAPGVVTIDDAGGNVQASGLQFASDGYRVTGDALTLTGTQAIVQVGDSSAASAAYTAVIGSELTGSAGLVKTDAGRLILTGTNSYTGGTTIDGGTLQLGNGGTTGSILGDIDNNGMLVLDRSNAMALDGTISGTGSLTKRGGGVLTLTGTNSYSGGTTVSGGTVQISSDANLGDVAGRLSLQGATLQASASFTSARDILVGSLTANRIDTQGFDVTLTGVIGNGANNQASNVLDKIGSGTLTLTGDNIYANRTVISGGTLALAGAGRAGVGDVTVGAGTIFDISQTNTGARVIQLGSGPAGTIALGSRMLTLGLENSFSDWSGTITDGGIAGGTGGSVVIAGVGGAVRYLEANSYTGGTTILSGRFELVGNGSLYSGGAVTVHGGVFDIAGIAGTGTTIGDLSGAGGGAGTIALGGKSLTFGTANSTSFTGTIAGAGGALVKNGTGTFTMSGANSYTGATTVNAGTLLVNGNQSAATGLTSVASGAALGGTGTIGGDVTVADGATLAPGAGGAGALTINGDLSLGSGSSLAFEFGRANAPGDPLNDLVNVGGNLTLDGTINVAVTPGGAFDIGLYRIANYAGTLTNNGLAIGTMPAGAELAVQTSIVGQVNLVNTGSAVLNFWDGNTGPKFNGAVNGGSGVWWATGTDNWTDMTGAVNASYDNGAFAIFAGTSGIVRIDNGQGAVTASGLQFAAGGGYRIIGDVLTLTGPQSVIRVGDGTSAGLGYSVIIASEITGNTQLVKTDLGRLELTGTNSYTGGTAINGGTVRISSDANLGAAAGGISFNGGTLNTTADLTSARAVDLAGQGVFSTDAGTTLTLTGNLTGAGLIGKLGAGTLVLAGTGSHTGGMGIVQGTLLVNGNYAAATGLVTMNQLTTLGGTGTIGGDVNLSGTLAPGAGGVGTLTINGDLIISPTATLAYEFGQAGVAGGALNDLVNVGGNLILDGTINVSVPTGGAFDVGVYRVFNYAGALTNNGLTLGTLPGGGNVAVQTSIAGQINLVNSAGLSLAFWDGGVGPKNDGVINGGSGTWQSSGGNDNWADASGAVNAAYSDGAFAVFGGTGGTVTVDNSLGQVTAAGMQFAANGYTITGSNVALTGPQSTVRVGDGSAAGAGFTATINAVLSGDTQLVKTDAGMLVLGGTNSYTGGTLINGGTVQISADANLGAAAGDVTLDGGTLATSASLTSARDIVMAGAGTISAASGTTFTFNGLLSGTGALTNRGAGTLLMTGNNSAFAGSTRVEGTMIVNGSLCGDVNVATGGRLGGTGTVCTTVNAGTVAPGNSIGTLTVAGSYTGNNGVLEIEAALGGDASPTDRLVVTNGTAGSTAVEVINVGGLGAQTVEGIKIVDVTGGTSAGTFTLNGDYDFEGSPAVIAGAFGYRLFQGGVSTPTDGDWYLRSALLDAPNEPQAPLYQPGVPLYESYASTLQTLNRLGTLQERVGNRQWSGFTQGGVGMWGRIEGTRHRPEAAFSTSGTDVDINSWQMQVGFDKALLDTAAGTLIAGINGRYGKADAHVRSRFGNGEIDTKGYGLGATVTWYDSTGFYADAQAQVSWYRSELDSTVLGELVDDNRGSGEAFSLEVGKRAPLGGGLSVTPQMQMAYSNVRFDAFADPNGAAVSSDRANSLRSRWGISVDHQQVWDGANGGRQSHVYGIVNLSYEWLDGSIANVSGTPIARRDDRLWGEFGIGGSYSWAGGRFTLFSEVSAETAINNFGDSNSLRGNAGFRMRF